MSRRAAGSAAVETHMLQPGAPSWQRQSTERCGVTVAREPSPLCSHSSPANACQCTEKLHQRSFRRSDRRRRPISTRHLIVAQIRESCALRAPVATHTCSCVTAQRPRMLTCRRNSNTRAATWRAMMARLGRCQALPALASIAAAPNGTMWCHRSLGVNTTVQPLVACQRQSVHWKAAFAQIMALQSPRPSDKYAPSDSSSKTGSQLAAQTVTSFCNGTTPSCGQPRRAAQSQLQNNHQALAHCWLGEKYSAGSTLLWWRCHW